MVVINFIESAINGTNIFVLKHNLFTFLNLNAMPYAVSSMENLN